MWRSSKIKQRQEDVARETRKTEREREREGGRETHTDWPGSPPRRGKAVEEKTRTLQVKPNTENVLRSAGKLK